MGSSKSCFARQEEPASLSATYQVPDQLSNTQKDTAMPFEFINVNEASEDELMTLPGVNRATARNIVEYRARIGGFRRIEDLALVSGLGAAKLASIRSEISIGSGSPSNSQAVLNRSTSNATAATRRDRAFNFANLSGSQIDLLAQLPLNEYASRRLVTPSRAANVVRVGTWNLQQCTTEKLQNRGVLEVICGTILEHDIALLALQELGSVEAVEQICAELNRPTISRLRKFVRELERAGFKTGQWRSVSEKTGRMFQSDEYAAYVYDASRVTVRGSSLLEKETRGAERIFTRSPLVCVADIDNRLRLLMCNVHLKCASLGERDQRNETEIANLQLLVQAVDAFKQTLDCKPHVLVLGDFNADPIDFRFDSLRLNHFQCVLEQKEFTNVSVKSPTGSHVYDQLWISADGLSLLTGHHRVVREHLTHPLIPADWKWNGYVSNHCPVYCELRLPTNEQNAQLLLCVAPPAGQRTLFAHEQ